MQIHYDSSTDLLYLRIEPASQSLINKRVDEDIVLDIGEDDKIVGIEIMDASKRINLDKLMPVEFPKPV
ncbi:MAG: DUF2283 domain-containing protein [Ilyomonas sp.]